MSSNGSKPEENRRRLLKLTVGTVASLLGVGALGVEEIEDLLSSPDQGRKTKQQSPELPGEGPYTFTPASPLTGTETPSPVATPTETDIPYDISIGEEYSFKEFEDCLSTDQRKTIKAELGNPHNFRYEPQKDGDLYDINILRDGEVVAYLDNEGLHCKVDESN